MGNKDTDTTFGFDPAPFLSGLKKVSVGLNDVGKKTEAVARGMGKAMFWALAKVQMLGAAVKRGVKAVAAELPEVGRTMSILKEIMLRNLLWPLRQFLTPYLKKILTWARDNRTLFVKIGQTIANAFRVAFTVIKTVWEISKKLWSALKPVFELIFGDMAQGLDDMINLLIAKVAVVAMYVMRAADPLIKGISKLVGDILPDLQEIGKAIVDIVTGLFSSEALWKSIGTILSSVVRLAVQTIAGLLTGLAPYTKAIGENIAVLAESFASLFKSWADDPKFKAFWESLGAIFGQLAKMGTSNIASFFTGLLKPLEAIWDPLSGIVASLKSLLDLFDLVPGRVNVVGGVLTTLGALIGGALYTAMSLIDTVIFSFISQLSKIGPAIEGIKAWVSGDKAGAAAATADIARIESVFQEGLGNRFGKFKDVMSSVGTTIGGAWKPIPENKPVPAPSPVFGPRGRTQGIPTGRIGASLGGSSMRGGPSGVSVSVAPMSVNLNVTEGDAQKAGMNFAVGMGGKLRDILIQQMSAAG